MPFRITLSELTKITQGLGEASGALMAVESLTGNDVINKQGLQNVRSKIEEAHSVVTLVLERGPMGQEKTT